MEGQPGLLDLPEGALDVIRGLLGLQSHGGA